MLRTVLGMALTFALVGAIYGLVKSALAEESLSVDPGLVITLAVTGAIGGAILARRHRS